MQSKLREKMSKEAELLKWIEQASGLIRTTEADALACLERGDVDKYNEGMRAKAEFLAGLSREAVPRLKGVDGKIAAHVKAELAGFSASASRSLEIGSVFFMSALLYPEDHRPGEPNNFDLFASELAGMIG